MQQLPFRSQEASCTGLKKNSCCTDGLFFGNWGDAPYGNVDCHIKDFTADNNNRQGLSISGSAIDVLFEDSVFSNTAGHCPAYGKCSRSLCVFQGSLKKP